MNRVGRTERERIYARAGEIVKLDSATQITNLDSAIAQIQIEFNISRDRARRAVVTAAMRQRGALNRAGRAEEEDE